MGKDHRKGKTATLATRQAFGQGVPVGPVTERSVTDYWAPADEEKRMHDVRQAIEDRKLARELGVPLEALR